MAVPCDRAGTGADLSSRFLMGSSQAEPVVIAFFDEVRRHGFIVGQNLTIERREFRPHLIGFRNMPPT